MSDGEKMNAGPQSDDPDGGYNGTSVGVAWLPMTTSIIGFLVWIFMIIAMSSYGWATGIFIEDKQGNNMLNRQFASVTGGDLGTAAMVHIALFHVYFDYPPNEGKDKALNDLCFPDPGNLTIRDEKWCQLATAGTFTDVLLWITMVPTIAAIIFTVILALKVQLPVVAAIFRKLSAIGLTEQVQNNILIFTWIFDWLFFFLSLMVYAGCLPDTIGLGELHFEASFGFVRLSFILVSISTCLLAADLLELWDEQQILESIRDIEKAQGLVQSVYAILLLQAFCYLFIAVERIEWQALVLCFGLYYLDSGKKNFVLMYVGTTITTLLFDMIYLSKLPDFDFMTGGKKFANALYVISFMLKPILLVMIIIVWQSEMIDTKQKEKKAWSEDTVIEDEHELPIAV